MSITAEASATSVLGHEAVCENGLGPGLPITASLEVQQRLNQNSVMMEGMTT